MKLWSDIKTVEWKIRPCLTGVDCWCREIYTKCGGVEVMNGGRLTKEMASYYTALQNARIRGTKLNYKKFEKIIFYDFDDGSVIDTDIMNKKWKVVECGVEDCWCGIINTHDDYSVIDDGLIGQVDAKYLVKLHNFFLKEHKNGDVKAKKKAIG